MVRKIINILSLLFLNRTPDKKTQSLYLVFIFFFSLITRLLAFFNTTVFYFSDFKKLYNYTYKINNGEDVELFDRSISLFIAHMGAWFIRYFGSINYWFYFNILLFSFSIIIVWFVFVKITRHRGMANLSVLLIALYPTLIMQPSVYYTQIIILFIESLIIFLLLTAFDTRNKTVAVISVILSSFLMVTSMFFKWELYYFHLFTGIGAIYLFALKYKKQAVVSLTFGIITLVFMQLTINYFEPIQKYLKYGENNLFFYGQTPYGGGEGVKLMEYKEQYTNGLKEFSLLHKREYDDPVLMKNAYQRILVKDFITNHPFQWLALQAKKFFRTLGIKPEGISFRLLVSGKVPVNSFTAGIMLTLPFLLLAVCCIFFYNRGLISKLFRSYNGLFAVNMLVYFLIATIFYPHYQIRYRIPLVFFFIIPAASAFMVKAFSNGNTIKSTLKKHLKWKVIVFVIFFCAWTYEAYDIFVLNKDRYVKDAQEYEEGIIR